MLPKIADITMNSGHEAVASIDLGGAQSMTTTVAEIDNDSKPEINTLQNVYLTIIPDCA
jgi:hypothetical protein